MENDLNKFSKATLVRFIADYFPIQKEEILWRIERVDRRLKFARLTTQSKEVRRKMECIAGNLDMLGYYVQLMNQSSAIDKRIKLLLDERGDSAHF